MQVIEAQCASILEPHDHLHISQIRALPPGHLIGRLLDLSHINWQTCAANQLSDHSDRHRRSIAGRPRQT
jgi:hypothetical protein